MQKNPYKYTEQQVVEMATEYLKSNDVRIIKTAHALHIPKSTVHWSLTHRLQYIDRPLYNLVMYKLKHRRL